MNERAITPESSAKSGSPRWQSRLRKPELIKVTERIFCAADYAISNVGFVITENGVVVVDTTETPKVAQRVFDELRKICRLSVSHIIYTHFHDDHVHGARDSAVSNVESSAELNSINQAIRFVYDETVRLINEGLPLRKFAGACACRRIWRGCRICRRATERSRGPSAVSFAITPAGMISIPPISSPRLGLPSTARCWRRAAGRADPFAGRGERWPRAGINWCSSSPT